MKMNKLAGFAILAILAACASAKAQNYGEVDRVDPAADAIVPANAVVEKLGDGFQFLEGPVWVHSKGQGLSAVQRHSRERDSQVGSQEQAFPFIWKRAAIPVRTIPTRADKPITDSEWSFIVGSNGITLDRQGRLVFCTHGDRELVRIEKNGKRTVLASRYEGKRLNSPNDVVVKSDGSIYFTDPPSGLRLGDKDPKKELSFNGVYRLKNGKLTLLANDFARPNGIAFSPDEKYLYVDDTIKKIIKRFDVQPDGTIANGQIITDMNSDTRPGAPDGMKVDQKGNIYCTGPGGFWIMSPEGKHLATVNTKQLPANLGWGDDDAKTLYLTARTGLYRIRLNIAGVRP